MPESVAERLQEQRAQMTRSEIQLAEVLLDEYPISGLCSITDLADKAAVSTPTVGRMVQKLGFKGYGTFQAALRAELAEMISNPIAKREVWKNDLPDEHILNRYARQAIENQRNAIEDVDPKDFDALCGLLSDPSCRIFIAGGRITGTIAQYLYLHLQMIRSDVRMLPAAASWPHDLLDIGPADVLIAFDVRRYENGTLQVAQMCHE